MALFCLKGGKNMRTKYNEDIKQKAREAGISLCELAFKAKISESGLFRWLRRPLSEEHKNILLKSLES